MFYFIVASIQSDEKTPTAETFSPPAEKSKLVKPISVPPPRESDFANNDNDIYSEECTELLDKLENLEEECETELSTVNISNPPASKTTEASVQKNVNLKLEPLELKEHIEMPKAPQKLTTPGKIL